MTEDQQTAEEVEQEYIETETEEHKVEGEGLLAKIKQIVHEGNVRRITIKNDEGQTLIEIPLTLGVVGALLWPVWAAIGAIAALAANFTLVVERKVDKKKEAASSVAKDKS